MRLGDLPIHMAGGSHGLRTIRLVERNNTYVADVPNDSLWTAVKDNLILREYERAGVSLSACRGVVVDAGAHVGLFSIRAANYASTVIALEAHPGNYEHLQKNIELNSLHHIRALREALWSSSGEVELVEGSHSAGGSILATDGKRFRTPSVTLAKIVSAMGDIDLLKLDIEGAEFAALDAAEDSTLTKIKSIVAELHLRGHTADCRSLVERLESLGFDVTVLTPPLQSPRESIGRTLSSWNRVRGVARLQLTVLTLYSLFGVLRQFSRKFRGLDSEDLGFLYAVQRNKR